MLLLRFELENHASFRAETELSFISTGQRDEPQLRFPAPSAPHGVLPQIGVWGANASGKSNLLEALNTFRYLVDTSFVGRPAKAPLPWVPFALNEESEPTKMAVDFVLDDVRYHYGFRFNADEVVEEWLFWWPNRRRQILFRRDVAADKKWQFGSNFAGSHRPIVAATRPNSLFLSAAAQFNHEQLSPVHYALADNIRTERTIMLRGYPLFDGDSVIVQPQYHQRLLKFLRAADLGVVDFVVEPYRAKRDEEAERAEYFEIHLIRRGGWRLPPAHESRGTLVALRRLENVLSALRDGSVVIFDEIDTSLHPDLAAELIALFSDPEINQNQAQLLFSTHNRFLMKRLRRDELVLAEKDGTGSSRLVSVAEFSDVRARDDVARLYAQGQLGGVPVLGSIASALTGGWGDTGS